MGRWTLLLVAGLGLACGGGAAPTPPEEVAPVAAAPVPVAVPAEPVQLPEELLGAWYTLRNVGGRWGVPTGCRRLGHVFEVVDGQAAFTRQMLIAEDESARLVAMETLPDGYRFQRRLAISEEIEPYEIRWLDPGHRRFRDDSDEVFVREAELGRFEGLPVDPEEGCDPTEEDESPRFAAVESWGPGMSLVGYREEGGTWTASSEELSLDLTGYKEPPALTWSDRTGRVAAYPIAWTLAVDGVAMKVTSTDGKQEFGVTFHRGDKVPPPLDPPLAPPERGAPVIEAPLPTGPLPPDAWFVRLPGLTDWRTVAWLPRGQAPGVATPGG